MNIRNQYQKYGVKSYYQMFGNTYYNPHEPSIKKGIEIINREWNLDFSNVLDLAAGNGEVTEALKDIGIMNVSGIDPYTFEIYEKRTGKSCEKFSFNDISGGVLDGRRYSIIFCSYALHLAEKSKLPFLIWRLASISPNLIILSPHKNPVIQEDWGVTLQDEKMVNRTRIRWYKSNLIDE